MREEESYNTGRRIVRGRARGSSDTSNQGRLGTVLYSGPLSSPRLATTQPMEGGEEGKRACNLYVY